MRHNVHAQRAKLASSLTCLPCVIFNVSTDDSVFHYSDIVWYLSLPEIELLGAQHYPIRLNLSCIKRVPNDDLGSLI